jgi:hypothetical protein
VVGNSGLTVTAGGLVVDNGGLTVTGNLYVSGTITSASSITGSTVNANPAPGTCCGQPSDARLKQNIVLLDSSLEKINKLRGVYFHWNRTVDIVENYSVRRQVGVIAQEVQAVLPEIVGNISDKYLGVDYAFLTPLLIEGIKELNNQTQSLRNILDENESDGAPTAAFASEAANKILDFQVGTVANATLTSGRSGKGGQRSRVNAIESSVRSLEESYTALSTSYEELQRNCSANLATISELENDLSWLQLRSGDPNELQSLRNANAELRKSNKELRAVVISTTSLYKELLDRVANLEKGKSGAGNLRMQK